MPLQTFDVGYALVIGAGADLPVTIGDATALRDLLVRPGYCAYPPGQVTLLVDQNATKTNILAALDDLRVKVAAVPDATVIIYYSGHGIESPDYYLLPYPYNLHDLPGTCISGTEFTERLQQLKAQKLLVLLDACHAGGLAEIEDFPGVVKSPAPSTLLETLSLGSGRVVIASSRKDQKSLILPGASYSAFTQALLEALAGQGAAEFDGYARVADVAMYVSRVVSARTNERQHPILKLHKADNFALAYYSGGEKSPHPPPGEATTPPPSPTDIAPEIALRYQGIRKKLYQNLLDVEEQMAEFFDEAAIPLDLKRTKKSILKRIAEVQEEQDQMSAAGSSNPSPRMPAKTGVVQPAHIFISYRRNTDPDQRLANHLYAALKAQGHDVFIDNTLRAGEAWLEEIDRQIRVSDYLVVLLSEKSADSEMLQGEVRRAYEYRKRYGQPHTLPVRIAYQGLLPYSIDVYLDPLQYVVWDSDADDERITEDILVAVEGKLARRPPVGSSIWADGSILSEDGRPAADGEALHPPLPAFDPRFLESLDAPGGALKLRDKFYLERQADARLKNEILKSGTTTTIRAPRQTGKTSLLMRGIQHARSNGASVACVDIQSLGSEHLDSMDSFLYELAQAICYELCLDGEHFEDKWRGSGGAQRKFTYFLEDQILAKSQEITVLALDEADCLLRTPFYKDFFALIRSWHDRRAFREQWQNLNLVMVISTEPYLLIADVNQSPFNVGLKLELKDFNAAQVSELNRRHGRPVKDADLTQFMELLNGHPYLTRQALYTLVIQPMSWEDLKGIAAADHGPFSDHLRRLHWLLRDEKGLSEALKQVIRHNRCTDEMALYRLLRAGLVKGGGDDYACRCGLYRQYFANKLL